MATDLTGLIASVQVIATADAKRAVDLSIPEAVLEMAKTLKFTFGAGANKADQIIWDRKVLAGDGAYSIDLYDGDDNPFKEAAIFLKIKAIVIFNRSDQTLDEHTATDAAVTIGNTAATEFLGPFHTAGDGITIPPGGMFVITNPTAAGWAVASDADLVDVKNEDADDEALLDIYFLGEGLA